MNSLATSLIWFAGFTMTPAIFAWIVEKKPQPNTYLLAMISFLMYSLGFFLFLFFPYKPLSMSLMIVVAVLSAKTAIAAIWVWKKYRKAYPTSQ